ncbi:TrmH family RNA methyltransferase [Liquorilactobacillus oeni]|uniref:23S rRNA methyltransferase n=1 Tax=Liquorilactobacillus oeni DSM 19972 TaxID=1423777 RepID=A0A0R1M808_9LACO|nr:RNA methyltransferase [Liquorilactobacillus oeni]KRL04230.1 23S rRNA methyltransferase [Liquorilactobacillus oeni DSM 19972]
MKIIRSVQNKQVKAWHKLATKKGRILQHSYFLDGWHLVKEALLSGQKITQLLLVPNSKYTEKLKEINNGKNEMVLISEEVARTLSDTPSPQGVFAIVSIEKPVFSFAEVKNGAWLLLDAVQDPGNIGTMVRTADAAGFKGVIFGKKTADIYQPKVIRAMQGSQFHISLLEGELLDYITEMKERKIPVFGTELSKTARTYTEVGKFENFGLIMGNEGNGVQSDILKMSTANLYIPIKGKAESLNVAVAAGILMFQLKK